MKDILSVIGAIFGVILAGVVATVLIISLIVLICTPFDVNRCSNTAAIMQVESQYHVSTGCMINVNNQWIPLSNYHIVDGE